MNAMIIVWAMCVLGPTTDGKRTCLVDRTYATEADCMINETAFFHNAVGAGGIPDGMGCHQIKVPR